MQQFLLSHEPVIRLACFALILGSMALLEAWLPRRDRSFGRVLRWPNNLGLTALNTLVLRFLFPTAAVGTALAIEAQGTGLLPWLGLPFWFSVIVAVVILDLAIYLQHVMFHAVPFLWRFHRMHHADLDLDVTSGSRFHPVEIVLSMLIKLMLVVALGAPAVAVLLFEVLLNATSMFNHANLKLPLGLDAALRHILVTPDMHRVHHSVDPKETHSNFGFNLSIWDRLMGTYRAQPEAGHEGMQIGLPMFRSTRELWLDRLISQPFRSAGMRSGNGLESRAQRSEGERGGANPG
jgi:sterol desaturase/sphingolipid hydroxylase (fatty acid hydroxylase superfamily)